MPHVVGAALHRADARDPVDGEHRVGLRRRPCRSPRPGWPVPVEVSLRVPMTQTVSGCCFRAFGDPVGVDRLAPLGVERDGVDPERLADAGPPRAKWPAFRTRALPPGGTVLTAAASIAPVPEAVRIITSFCVWKTSFSPADTSVITCLGLGRSVVDHRPGQLEQHVLGDRGGPRGHQSRLTHRRCPCQSVGRLKGVGLNAGSGSRRCRPATRDKPSILALRPPSVTRRHVRWEGSSAGARRRVVQLGNGELRSRRRHWSILCATGSASVCGSLCTSKASGTRNQPLAISGSNYGLLLTPELSRSAQPRLPLLEGVRAAVAFVH